VNGDLSFMGCAGAALCSAIEHLPMALSVCSHSRTLEQVAPSDEMVRRPRLRNE